MYNKKKMLIVNPLVAPEYLSQQLHINNIHAIGLYTNSINDIDSYNLPKNKVFDDVLFISFDDLIKQNFKQITQYKFDYILNGAEEFTKEFDQITKVLTPNLSNNPLTSEMRYNKYAMQEVLYNKHLGGSLTYYIDVLSYTSPSYLPDLTYPIFCKPRNGYGSINASKINNYEALMKYLDDMRLEQWTSSEYLVQPYIAGDEFVVDAFSLNGIHYITNIFQYKKILINQTPVYRSSQMLEDSERCIRLSKYMQQVLTALDVKNGLTHSEIIMDSQGNFHFIELNNRINGAHGAHLKLANYIGQATHLDYLINYILYGEIIHKPQHLQPKLSNGIICFAFNGKSINKDIYMQQLEGIKSTTEIISININSNASSKKRISMLDLFALTILTNTNKQELINDINKFIELDGLDV